MIYLDNSATTKPSATCVSAMTRLLCEHWGNPSSVHNLGIEAERELKNARKAVANALGAEPERVFFTSGGTEADNWAIFSACERLGKRGRHIITTVVEHHAVLHPFKALEARGFEVTYLQPDEEGFVSVDTLKAALRPDTILVSVMMVNNETGAVMPIADMIRATRRLSPLALFHTDAIQGYLHIPLDATELGVDAMSVAAHKIGGPVASGALYVKTRTPLRPRIFGGGQEAGRRAGTQDLRTQLAFAAAARTLAPHVAQEREKLQALSDKLYATLTAHPRIHATMGDYAHVDRLPGMVSIYIDGMDSEDLIWAASWVTVTREARPTATPATPQAMAMLRGFMTAPLVLLA